jgi:uncharacterized membrane protein
MPATALAFALMSAVISAVWNLLLKRSGDTQAASAIAIAAAVILFAPALAFGSISAAAWPFIVASAGLEFVYFALLAAAYRRAEMSLIFPLARGLGPVIVLLVSVLALHVRASGGEFVGVLLVAIGAVAVRGLRLGGGLADTGLAVLIAACVAGYTLVDKYGVARASPVAYFEAVLALVSGPYLILVARTRGLRSLGPELRLRTVVIGVGIAGGYDLVLEGLRLAQAAPVAAVRESSVVIGTALAVVVLHERVGPSRWLGAILVTAGIAVLGFAVT